MARKKVTPKQEKFVETYIETNNATEAAAQVYDCKNRMVAKSIGTENLSKPSIQELVKQRQGELMEEIRNRSFELLDSLIDVATDKTAPHSARVQAARDLLDRLGVGEAQKIEITGSLTHTHIAQVLDRARQVIASGGGTGGGTDTE